MKRAILKLLLIFHIVLLVSCNWAVWKDDPIDYGNGQGSTNSSFLFSGTAPTSVYATRARFSDKITISWNSVTGADFYEVFKAEADSATPNIEDLEWERMTIAPMGTSLTDSDVETGKFYAYRVRGRSSSLLSILGDYSDIAVGWVLMPPSNFSASQGEDVDSIFLTWDTVSSINGYRIEWSDTTYEGSWNIAIPAGMDAEDYVITPNIGEFDFHPANQYKGKSLYFRIRSISSAGDESEASGRRVGYTYVEGAPDAPNGFIASQGESATEIKLSWNSLKDGDGEEYKEWEISRSIVGHDGSETVICSTQDGDTPPESDGTTMTYVDKRNLEAGVVYHYTIRAIGEVQIDENTTIMANGLPSEAEGFLLSPPSIDNSSMEITTQDGQIGFRFTITEPLGAEDHRGDWTYRIYGSKNNRDWVLIQTIDPAKDDLTIFSPYIGNTASSSVRSTVLPASDYEYFTTETVSSSGETSQQLQETTINDRESISFARPGAASGYNVTDNLYVSGMSVSDGVYSVGITLEEDSLVDYYNVRIWHKEPASINAAPDETKVVEVPADPTEYGTTGNAIILFNVATPKFGTKYWIAIQGVDTLGREGEWSSIDSGYGAITGAKLIQLMQAYGLKPWESIDKPILTQSPGSAELNQRWKDSGIYNKVKQAGTGSLGSVTQESITGDGGTISYNAVVSGLGGRVTFSYRNFGEVDFLKISGNYVMDVDMGGTGSCNGAITMNGWYPASIGFDNISVSSQKFVGTYTVTQTGRASEEVSPNQ